MEVLDYFKQSINIGDIIEYTTRTGSSIWRNIGVVEEFIKKNTYDGVKISAKVLKFENKTDWVHNVERVESKVVTIHNLSSCIVINEIICNMVTHDDVAVKAAYDRHYELRDK